MIVPMKKVSLIVLDSERERTLKKLRKIGLLHIEMTQGTSTRISELKEQIALLERAIYAVVEKVTKTTVRQAATTEEVLAIAERIAALEEEKNACHSAIAVSRAELERLKDWGEIDPASLAALAAQGVDITPCEMPPKEYAQLDDTVKTLVLSRTKSAVRFLVINQTTDTAVPGDAYRLRLPQQSTAELTNEMESRQARVQEIDRELEEYAGYADSMKAAIAALQKDTEFETYATGMNREVLAKSPEKAVAVAYFNGYIPADSLARLQSAAKENAWGLVASDPTEEDDVPTQLKNNKFVSLIYPLTDFLGTVPGYFEYDISAWFLGFMLIFFGIIFGDGGYGLLICAVAAALILKTKAAKKTIPATYLLIALFGAATVLWGTLTCTWFGMAPEQLPAWLCKLSLPIISNVNADRLWHPFWTSGDIGLTTAQNLQILCFSLALVQLSVAHILGAIRNRRSLKILGDIGSVLQLIGMFYVVLTLVVNGEVFGLSRVIGGIPVGTLAIACVGIGFVLSFVFANYEGSIKSAVLISLKNIVSVLLGVVNVFSDIVSYIRLWAVGLAGAAISATVNELAGPLFGKLVFIVFAVILLVFGHGLNMILNLLSVIVHGVRLNTLEFSTHLDMSWSGHKYTPFEE